MAMVLFLKAELTQKVSAGDSLLCEGSLQGIDGGGEDVGLL